MIESKAKFFFFFSPPAWLERGQTQKTWKNWTSWFEIQSIIYNKNIPRNGLKCFFSGAWFRKSSSFWRLFEYVAMNFGKMCNHLQWKHLNSWKAVLSARSALLKLSYFRLFQTGSPILINRLYELNSNSSSLNL